MKDVYGRMGVAEIGALPMAELRRMDEAYRATLGIAR